MNINVMKYLAEGGGDLTSYKKKDLGTRMFS